MRVAATLLLLFGSGCSFVQDEFSFVHQGVAIVVHVQSRGHMTATVFEAGPAGPEVVGRLAMSPEGQLSLRTLDDDVVGSTAPAAMATPALFVPLAYAATQMRLSCVRGPDCERGDGGQVDREATDFAAFGHSRAEALLRSAPLPRQIEERTECSAVRRYDGDERCTGWVGVAFTPGQGFQDISYCCLQHDLCYYECPIAEDGSCRTNDCMRKCNDRISRCCADAGGDLLTCATWTVATNIGGGGSVNGCGKNKLVDYCGERDFSSCEDDRCLCEVCNELTGETEDCSGCACESECALDDDPVCVHDARGHHIRRCATTPYDENCAKLYDDSCAPDERCEVNHAGEPACVPQDCPTNDCDFAGQTGARCEAGFDGSSYMVCTYDTFGCLGWQRVYCDGADGSGGGCVMLDSGPVCTSSAASD